MTCSPYQYVILSTLISLITVVYLYALFSFELDSSTTELPGLRSFLSDSVDAPSTTKGLSLKFLDLNILYATLFHLFKSVKFLNQQRIAALVFLNAGFLFLYVLGKLVTKLFFTQLREVEYQHIYDRVLNFLLFKVVFLGSVLEPKWDEMVLWLAWLAGIGFLRVLSMLCRDRCEYVCESGVSDQSTQRKLLVFLSLIFVANTFWFIVCLYSFRSLLFLLTFECLTLSLDTFQTLAKYLIHIKDVNTPEIWEKKDLYLRKTEFFTDAAILIVTLLHYVQIAYIHGVSFTLIDAVLFLNIRSVFKSLRRKHLLYQNYLSALTQFESRFPCASEEDLKKYGDSCAICLEEMKIAQKLPCNHIFHALCLRRWVESHQSCPTCRKELEGSNESYSSLEFMRSISSNPDLRSTGTALRSTNSEPPSPSAADWDRGLSVVNDLRY